MSWKEISGVKTKYQVVKEGTGGKVYVGDTVTVHAKGTVTSTGKVFWDTRKTKKPFTYQAGVGGVILGWDKGVMGMKVGEVRKLDIPAAEGYGQAGFPAWGIPKNGDISFEIEVIEKKSR